jgi:methionyl-tRNA formyltransferase
MSSIKKRVVILATDYRWQSSILVGSALRILLSSHHASEITVYISGTKAMREEKFRALKLLCKYLLRQPNIKFFMLFNKAFTQPISRQINKFGVANTSMAASTINDDNFIKSLDLRDEASLIILGWPVKLNSKVLDKFHTSINYHDGELPTYRGTYGTQWSIYNNEVRSGFTFHEVNEHLDSGRQIATGFVPIGKNDTFIDVELRKINCAKVAFASALKFHKTKEHSISVPRQVAAETLYTKQMAVTMYSIKELSILTSKELRLRIKAFGGVKFERELGKIWITRKHKISINPSSMFGLYRVFELADSTYVKVFRFNVLNTIKSIVEKKCVIK